MRAMLALFAALLATPLAAQSPCRQALVMALDVSSSVDEREYALQMQGLAGALSDPEVAALLLANPAAPVALAIFEWSDRFNQRLILDWTFLRSQDDLARIAARLAAQARPATISPTAIGHALAFAGQMLESGPDCWRRTVDISGDGKNNTGFRPSLARQAPIFERTTVNALVIGSDEMLPSDRILEDDIARLSAYFRAEVIHGPDAFIETAIGFQDFQAAMKRKLLRELDMVVAGISRP